MPDHETRPRISVAMCTYNGERYLKEQLESIENQLRTPFELIVCDDRSKDATIDILHAFAQRALFPVFIFENQHQLGSTRNFDKAMRLCRGEYIALTDQDDCWVPEKLEVLGAILDGEQEVGMAFSDADLIDDASRATGGRLWESLSFGPTAQAAFIKDPGRVLLERPVVTGATMIFRQSLLDHFTEVPATWVHDGWVTWMSILWARARFIPQSLTKYRVHSSQQLGVGRHSLLVSAANLRQKRRAHHAGVAKEFQDLLAYIENSTLNPDKCSIDALKQTIRFRSERANAPHFLPGRLLFLVKNVSSYKNISGPNWRAMAKDLMMGQSE